MKSYLLKIRGGVEVDSYGKKAGKGPLIAEEISNTLGTNQDQYLFQPIAFEPGIAAREGGHIYEGISGTLRSNAGDNQMNVAYCVENHPADSRVRIKDDGIVQTLDARMGMGGGNVPLVMFSKVRRAKSKDDYETWGAKGVSNTLNTFDNGDVRATDVVVCYGISSYDSNAMKSDNPKSGIYEAKTSRTLDLDGGNPACNQGGMIVLEGNGQRPSHQGDGYSESETMYTLNTIEKHAVCYWDGGQVAGTLTAQNSGGGQRMPDKNHFQCVIEQVDSRGGTAYSIGNGQVHDAMSPSEEVCKTLNCMDDPMKILIRK